jgi:4'-phosphopantetheinyl transferase
MVTHTMHISAAAFEIEAPLRLPEEEVHLWRVDLATAAAGEERWQQILSADENARAARFHFARDRCSFTATRAVLRTLLSGYVGSDPKALVIRYSEKDKPYLGQNHLDQKYRENPVEFNVSHSGTIALLAFARGRTLGVDVERIREDFDVEPIARRFFSEREQGQLAALPSSEKVSGFFRCWTRKEAFIKAIGSGLSLPLDQFDVSLTEGDGSALLATRPDHREAARWSLQGVPVSDGYVAALCVQGQGWRLQC